MRGAAISRPRSELKVLLSWAKVYQYQFCSQYNFEFDSTLDQIRYAERMITVSPGRRERKKAATRKLISDTATSMFLERGYENVSIREIADAADVSPTTVFAHFAQKEAIVFDEDDEQREQLIGAVRDRASGVSISDALQTLYVDTHAEMLEHGDGAKRFMEMLESTPALRDYGARMWTRHEAALAVEIARELGQEPPSASVRLYARFALQIQVLALQSDDPIGMIEAGFSLLDNGLTLP